MDHFAVDKALSTMAVLCDTREQDTLRARKRFKQIGVPIERAALSFGDYSVRCDVLDLRDNVAIERKMDLSELAHCYCQERKRFVREFERAKEAGAKLYLLVENGSLDEAYSGHYRARVHPKSLILSFSFTKISSYSCQRPEDVIYCLRYLVVLSRGVMPWSVSHHWPGRSLLFLSPSSCISSLCNHQYQCLTPRIAEQLPGLLLLQCEDQSQEHDQSPRHSVKYGDLLLL